MLRKLIVGVMILLLSFATPSTAAEKQGAKGEGKASGSAVDKKVQPSLCREVALMIENDTIDKYMPERVDIAPRASEYINIDIDKDNKMDKVTVDSGSEGSYLQVWLSGGSHYNLEEGFMMVVKIKEKIYALVTYWKWERQADGSDKGEKVGNLLYRLTSDGTELVCDKQDLREGE